MTKIGRLTNKCCFFAVLCFLNNFYLYLSIVILPEQLERNLCRSKVCPNYGKCVIDENNFFAKCICPSECDHTDNSHNINYGAKSTNRYFNKRFFNHQENSLDKKDTKSKHHDKESISNELFSQTICGNDGKNYKSFCDLKQQSCLQNKEIKIFYFGKCSNKKFLF